MQNAVRRCATVAVLVAALAGAYAPHALAVNETSAGLRELSSANIDAVKGQQGIRAAPLTVNEVSDVHPTQLDIGSAGAAFIAIGTYNGSNGMRQ